MTKKELEIEINNLKGAHEKLISSVKRVEELEEELNYAWRMVKNYDINLKKLQNNLHLLDEENKRLKSKII